MHLSTSITLRCDASEDRILFERLEGGFGAGARSGFCTRPGGGDRSWRNAQSGLMKRRYGSGSRRLLREVLTHDHPRLDHAGL